MTKRRTGIILVAITAVLILASLPSPAAKKPAAKSKTQLTRDLNKVNQKIRYVQAKIREARKQHKTLSGQLQYTEQRLNSTQSRVSHNKIVLAQAEAKLAAIKRHLALKERQLARRSKLLSRRLVDVYEGQNLSYLNVLLGSTDVWTLLTRSYYIDRIIKSDADLIKEINRDKVLIERDKRLQNAKVRQIASLQIQLISDRDDIQALADAREGQLQDIENDAARYEQMMDELQRQSEAIGAMIRKWQATPRGQARYAKKYTGGYGLPVSGRITSRFGYRFHPILKRNKMHTGVDIAAPSGTPIAASGSGEVIYASWYGAYGNAIIADHGGGVTTLYGHCSRINVRVGQEVKRGQTIGRVGSTGWSTGPHLHYEKQVHGRPVNPM